MKARLVIEKIRSCEFRTFEFARACSLLADTSAVLQESVQRFNEARDCYFEVRARAMSVIAATSGTVMSSRMSEWLGLYTSAITRTSPIRVMQPAIVFPLQQAQQTSDDRLHCSDARSCLARLECLLCVQRHDQIV